MVFRGGDTHVQNAKHSQDVKDYIQPYITWQQGLGEKGLEGGPIQTTNKRVNEKNKVMAYCLFIKAEEMVDGYLIINAEDIDEAVKISMRAPVFKEDEKVEVHPIHKQN